MICDKIIYKGHDILTIYHRGFDDSIHGRRLNKTEKVGKWNLTFTEFLVDDAEAEIISEWNEIEKGLICPSSPNNPYGDQACARMTHYIYVDKPLSIFKLQNDFYDLKLSVQDFTHICDFIGKYTGLNVQSNPMILGDIFVFDCLMLSFKRNENNSIILKNVPEGTAIIVDFKYNGMIVSSKTATTSKTYESLEICSNLPWESHDIKVYSRNELIFCQSDVSYIQDYPLQ